jgi:hypothetical protein
MNKRGADYRQIISNRNKTILMGVEIMEYNNKIRGKTKNSKH